MRQCSVIAVLFSHHLVRFNPFPHRPRPEARPGRERLVVPPAHAARRTEGLAPSARLRDPARRRRARHPQAAQPRLRRPRPALGHGHGRVPLSRRSEGRKPRDTVKILSDFGPDGRAAKIKTFADGLNIPIGLLPLPSARAALVHSIPNIYLLTDTDGDGQADRREVALRRLRPSRHPRHDQRLHLGLRRLDLRLPRLLQRLARSRARTIGRSA